MTETPKKTSKLDLASTEIDKISKIARDNKFETKGLAFLYDDDPQHKLDNFIKGYRFLFHIANETDDAGIGQKIQDYLNSLKSELQTAIRLQQLARLKTHFALHRNKRNVALFVTDNLVTIENLLDIVYPLGKVVKQYDPGETQGYY